MADSADDLLRQAREALHDWITADESTPAEWNASGRLASAFEMLDALMSSGGPLPTDWVPAADRPVINIVSHIPDIVDLPDGDQVFAPVLPVARHYSDVPFTGQAEAYLQDLREPARPVTDVPGPDGDGLRECATCGARIRRVNARDGIDPADMDSYPWVDGSGNPFCDGPPVHVPGGGA